MRRRRKLEVGNFSSWEERIDYQLGFAYDRIDRCKDTDRLQAGWIGELQSDVGRLRADLQRELADLRRDFRYLVAFVALALCVMVGGAIGVLVVVT